VTRISQQYLARQLYKREPRPIHAIVEDALVQNAARHPQPSAASFLRRLKSLAVSDVDLDSLIAENRKPHDGIDL
jgi:hypothetical protein